MAAARALAGRPRAVAGLWPQLARRCTVTPALLSPALPPLLRPGAPQLRRLLPPAPPSLLPFSTKAIADSNEKGEKAGETGDAHADKAFSVKGTRTSAGVDRKGTGTNTVRTENTDAVEVGDEARAEQHVDSCAEKTNAVAVGKKGEGDKAEEDVVVREGDNAEDPCNQKTDAVEMGKKSDEARADSCTEKTDSVVLGKQGDEARAERHVSCAEKNNAVAMGKKGEGDKSEEDVSCTEKTNAMEVGKQGDEGPCNQYAVVETGDAHADKTFSVKGTGTSAGVDRKGTGTNTARTENINASVEAGKKGEEDVVVHQGNKAEAEDPCTHKTDAVEVGKGDEVEVGKGDEACADSCTEKTSAVVKGDKAEEDVVVREGDKTGDHIDDKTGDHVGKKTGDHVGEKNREARADNILSADNTKGKKVEEQYVVVEGDKDEGSCTNNHAGVDGQAIGDSFPKNIEKTGGHIGEKTRDHVSEKNSEARASNLLSADKTKGKKVGEQYDVVEGDEAGKVCAKPAGVEAESTWATGRQGCNCGASTGAGACCRCAEDFKDVCKQNSQLILHKVEEMLAKYREQQKEHWADSQQSRTTQTIVIISAVFAQFVFFSIGALLYGISFAVEKAHEKAHQLSTDDKTKEAVQNILDHVWGYVGRLPGRAAGAAAGAAGQAAGAAWETIAFWKRWGKKEENGEKIDKVTEFHEFQAWSSWWVEDALH